MMRPELLHNAETLVWGDQAHGAETTVTRDHASNARGFTNR
jgi:hypothetical protein